MMRRGRHRPREVRLTTEQADLVLSALYDGGQVRYQHIMGWCQGCERSASGACAAHQADLGLVHRYRDVTEVIRQQLAEE